MTRHPFFPEKQTRPAYLAIVLVILLTALLVAAGCESESTTPADSAGTTVPATLKTVQTRIVTTTIPPATTMTIEPEPVTMITTEEPVVTSLPTIAVSGNYHQEYIKMDATVYAIGEVVQFYLVNKGPEISGCDYAHPPYTVYHLSPDGTRFEVAAYDPARTFMTMIIEGEPGTATGPFSLDTRKLSPGRYLIRFDCGNNVAREFVIMSRVNVIGT